MTVTELDFTKQDQRHCEWINVNTGLRYRFMDRSTGCGFHVWMYDPKYDVGDLEGPGAWCWMWSGVMVTIPGPYVRVDPLDEHGEDADNYSADW